jgi:hypothetical protein
MWRIANLASEAGLGDTLCARNIWNYPSFFLSRVARIFVQAGA